MYHCGEIQQQDLDSYVLSESSLFIYPWKLILKTCGTTQILNAIPFLLDFAAGLSLKLRCSKYTRGTYIFPENQPFPHGNFGDEVRCLEKYFGTLGSGGTAYVMGNSPDLPNWHVCTTSGKKDSVAESTYTMEMCMTKLDVNKAALFFNEDGSKSGLDMTLAAGIRKLLPHSKICDVAFDPCGYCMNSIEDGAHSTIHVTPEAGMSFASFETMGYDPKDISLPDLVGAVTSMFNPGSFSVYLHATVGDDGVCSMGSWRSPVCPKGYVCTGSSRQELSCGSVAMFHTYKAAGFPLHMQSKNMCT